MAKKAAAKTAIKTSEPEGVLRGAAQRFARFLDEFTTRAGRPNEAVTVLRNQPYNAATSTKQVICS